MTRDHDRPSEQELRRDARARRARPDGRAGRGVRIPRPERRRQDDDDPAACSGFTGRAPGRAELFGVDAWRDPVQAHRRLAYVAGEPFLWPALTGAETLEFLARLHGGTDVGYRGELVERFELDTRKKIRALSKGNRQKVQLVAALSTRADLLLLDEPTSGLDPLMEVAFRDCIEEAKARGQTVFLSSHILSEVEALCDRVGILKDGRLVDEGTLAAASPPERADGRGDVPRRGRRSSTQLPGVHVHERRSERRSGSRSRGRSAADRRARALTESRRWRAASRRSRRSSCTTTTSSDGHVDADAAPRDLPRAGAERGRAPAIALARRAFLDSEIARSVRVPVRRGRLHPAGRLPRCVPDARRPACVCAQLRRNKAIRLFYGAPHDLLTVGGYTAWRVGGTLAIFAAAFGLLAAVRALRDRGGCRHEPSWCSPARSLGRRSAFAAAHRRDRREHR